MEKRRRGRLLRASVVLRSSGPVLVDDLPRPVIRPLPLTLFEDLRTFHPLEEARPVGVVSRRDARRLIERPRKAAYAARDPFPSLRLGFAVPQKVVKCVRRKQRREALFAFGRTGAGSQARRRRRDQWSDVQC